MEWPLRGPVVTGSFRERCQNIRQRRRQVLYLFPSVVLFNYFFLIKIWPSLEPEIPQAVKKLAKSKQKEVRKQDRSPGSSVSLEGLRQGSEDRVVGMCGRSVGPLDL